MRLFSNRSQMTSKCVKNKKVAHEAIAECVTDVLTTFLRPLWSITDLDAWQHGICLFYTIKHTTWAFYFLNYSNAGLCSLSKYEKKPFDVICGLYKMKQSHWFAMHNKELWLVQKNHATVKLDWNGFSWNENLQRKQNWTAKFTNVKENAGQISVFVIRAALWPEKPECFLNIAGVERIRSENVRLQSTLDAIWFEFWMKGGLPTVEICVLCG